MCRPEGGGSRLTHLRLRILQAIELVALSRQVHLLPLLLSHFRKLNQVPRIVRRGVAHPTQLRLQK
jgi:hypothetical protein